jgi:hypothetical protein
MNFIKYITMILLSLEPSYSDKETWEERSARMEIVAEAIEDASSKATCEEEYNTPDCKKTWIKDRRSLALLLITKGFWESRFAKNVHEGKCRPDECDAYTTGSYRRHRARSPWQVQRTGLVSKEEYNEMSSSTLESTKMSANVAARYLIMGMNNCKTISGSMSIYGGAKSCTWSGVKPRVDFYNRLSARTEEDFQKLIAEKKSKLAARLISEKKK